MSEKIRTTGIDGTKILPYLGKATKKRWTFFPILKADSIIKSFQDVEGL